jgi:hypothetical protein
MKYFESTNTYYKKISTEDYNDIDNKYWLVDHSDSEIKRIESILSDSGKRNISFRVQDLSTRSKKINIIKCQVYGLVEIQILKYEDEYFLVKWDELGRYDNWEYYLCDQFDGVVKLLNDLIKKIKLK